jgi:hypothetical protein
MTDRSIPALLAIYFGVFAALGGGAYFAYTTFTQASERMEQHRSRERTVLDERLATMRSIKEALRKPQPKPEPLPPITAKVANPHPKIEMADKAEKQKKTRKLSKEARDAFASFEAPSGSSSALSFDRHSMRGF